MRQALPVHVALEQRALVRPPRAGLHFISNAKPIAVVNLRNDALSVMGRWLKLLKVRLSEETVLQWNLLHVAVCTLLCGFGALRMFFLALGMDIFVPSSRLFKAFSTSKKESSVRRDRNSKYQMMGGRSTSLATYGICSPYMGIIVDCPQDARLARAGRQRKESLKARAIKCYYIAIPFIA